ncbi:MAG: NtrZ family periplasmic regulatory protein [Pseudomonadota bacterium]
MRAVIASFGLICAIAMPAMAQSNVPEMPAPSLAETEQAQPDWYQQFTFSSNDIASPAWQAEPSQTFSLAWVKGDRWSVSVDMTSRDTTSPLPAEEMSVGSEFRITPRISVGGELSIGSNDAVSISDLNQQDIEAGIRLRSAFKF